MLKPGLGKGLGRLMNGDSVAGKAPAPREIGRGLQTLIAAREDAAPDAPARKLLLPAWFFFAADILLLAFSVALCFDAPKPLDSGTIIFCAVSIWLGAVLAIIGILRAA